MPTVRTPTNANEAASYAMLGMLRLAIGFAIWGATLGSLLPNAAYFPLRFFNRFLTSKTRMRILIGWHGLAATLSGTMALAVGGGWALQAQRNRHTSMHSFICQADAIAGTFADNRLVAALTLLLFLLYARLFVDRGVAVLCGARSAGLFTRVARAVDAGSLWWLVSEGSPLAVPLAFVLAVDWCTARSADVLKLCNKPRVKHATMLHNVTSLLGSCALAHWGGQAFVDSCPCPKRNASVVVVHALLWAVSLMRAVLKEAFELKVD